MWSTNGYIQIGAETSDLSGPNQNLPNPTTPNNVLAPLWADLDLDACVTGSNKMGWYFGSASDGPIIYDIFEWKEAALKSDPSTCFSFQVWIKRGTDEIWFVYGPQTGSLSAATVGLENQHGSAGYSYYYNGSGTAPIEGTTLKVINSVDEAILTYALAFGPALGVDVTNVVHVTNSRTDRVLQASATVHVSLQIYLHLLIH